MRNYFYIITIVLASWAVFASAAHAATPAARPITLRLENASLREALLAMQGASGL